MDQLTRYSLRQNTTSIMKGLDGKEGKRKSEIFTQFNFSKPLAVYNFLCEMQIH